MRYIRLRLLLAALLTLTALLVAAEGDAQTDASTTQQTTTEPVTTTAATPPQCPSVGDHKRTVVKALRFSAINGNFIARKNTKALKLADQMRACARAHFPYRYKLMKRGWAKRLKTYRFYHYIDLITPYGAWAVPPAIVRCEGGFHGWRTYNHGGSGAAGPYQLLGWGAPMPATSPRAMAMHHIIAHRLYAAHGSQPWASSSGCWG